MFKRLCQFCMFLLERLKEYSLLCAILTLAFASCKEPVEHGGKTPLVQVGTYYLYHEDISRSLPYGLSASDSVVFVREFVRKWIEEQVLYEKAEHNVRDDDYIERMVDDYRRTLVLNKYERELLQQKMTNEISEEELRNYYDENKQLFLLDEPMIKGVFIKAPLSSPGLKDLKRWYKDGSDESLEQLEKYAFRNAVLYEYFLEQWITVSELESKVGVNLTDMNADLEKCFSSEHQDEEYCYLLHIAEYLTEGEEKPYDLARYEIIDLLANNRKVEFMQKVKNDLYNQSIEMGRIKYYYNEKQIMYDSVRHAINSSTNIVTR